MDKKLLLIKEWLRKAEHDLGMAELAIKNKPEYTDSICFHCQQASEKYLKAYLVFLNIRFEKKHNLDYLLDLISEKEKVSEEFYEMLEKLEDYAVEIRYPDDWFEPELADAKESYEIARRVKEFVLDRIKLCNTSL
ncbi:MAG: HEPN domain-containing protein [Nitrospinae bacterium]|nr:HEPN domain-containing protein [Nitrospinota bacterium]